MRKVKLVLVGLMSVVMAACSNWGSGTDDESSQLSGDPIVVRVSGYGTLDNPKDKTSDRKRLMAMRASKLDAYRALAERVYGTVIYGNSTVRDFSLQGDQLQSYVDSWIRGARVIAVNEPKNGTFETVVELRLESSFRHCLTHTNFFRYSENCRIPLPPGDDRASDTPANTEHVGSLYYLD